jgi:phenylpropionate dioxygenase-like ring-hydroxylating dioxygenase large terminal subunit
MIGREGSMLTDDKIDELVDYERGCVHASIYNDREIFDTEMTRIFQRSWVYLGHDSEIALPGDYKTAYLGQVPVIVSRTDDGKIHGLINRCAHRGTTVCQWDRGNSSYFRCEYHGWTYRNDGELIGVTQKSGYAPAEFEGINSSLDRIPRVDSYRGLIFGSLSPTGQSLDEFLGVTKRYIDDWMDASPTGEIVVTGGVWRHRYDANWKIGLEGSDERYHVDSLHKIARVLIERKTGKPFRFQPADLSWLKTIDAGHGHGVSEINSDALPRPWRETNPPEYVDALIERLGEKRTGEVLGRWARWHTFPNAAFTTDNIRVLRPISPNETEVYQYHVSFPEIEGVTERINERRVADHQNMYGPAGYVGPDDHEMFSRIQEGYRALGEGMNPWVWFSRGSSKAERGPDGELIGLDQTELSQRSIYAGWLECMKGDG